MKNMMAGTTSGEVAKVKEEEKDEMTQKEARQINEKHKQHAGEEVLQDELLQEEQEMLQEEMLKEQSVEEKMSPDQAQPGEPKAHEHEAAEKEAQAGDAISPCQALEKTVEHLKEELAQERERTLRALADHENYRRRMQRELDNAARYGVRPLAEKLLPAIDNFERALLSGADKEDAFYQGVAMIHRQLVEALEASGITEIAEIHVPFDPSVHQAVGMVEGASPDRSGQVAEVLQKGYLLHDRLIRPAMVKVYA
ncbi:MAG: nucleotide exchange factor GrpE [Candidatus Carbobacillus altaicus]|nr:nucleotide exchange factor GrpE [Candidatus Carbobacillus altaicus]